MKRVTADANIYISAFEFRGKPSELLTVAVQRRIELTLSDHINLETARRMISIAARLTLRVRAD